jgi:hypothetical protein
MASTWLSESSERINGNRLALEEQNLKTKGIVFEENELRDGLKEETEKRDLQDAGDDFFYNATQSINLFRSQTSVRYEVRQF